ncbi:hypothetical protein AMJ57_04410 [Parcubacteria bacterium SG8_24]|nr:MAG: hypothetical protein AMJ57_04410 [Parcubacteria bacterium SG8_24]
MTHLNRDKKLGLTLSIAVLVLLAAAASWAWAYRQDLRWELAKLQQEPLPEPLTKEEFRESGYAGTIQTEPAAASDATGPAVDPVGPTDIVPEIAAGGEPETPTEIGGDIPAVTTDETDDPIEILPTPPAGLYRPKSTSKYLSSCRPRSPSGTRSTRMPVKRLP